MIPINSYRQFIAELINYAKQQAEVDESITIRLAVTESQLVKLVKDLDGIVVAGNIPGADISNGSYFSSEGECLLMVLEKMPEDEQGLEAEYDRFARLQKLMLEIVKLLTNYDGFDHFCDKGTIDYTRPINIEWEYNTLGGFNGLSVSFRLNDKEV